MVENCLGGQMTVASCLILWNGMVYEDAFYRWGMEFACLCSSWGQKR